MVATGGGGPSSLPATGINSAIYERSNETPNDELFITGSGAGGIGFQAGAFTFYGTSAYGAVTLYNTSGTGSFGGGMLLRGVKAGASALDAVNKSQLDTKQNMLTIDESVDQGSSNPVSGNAVWNAVDVVETNVNYLLYDIVPDQNSGAIIKKWYGTQAEYDAIPVKDSNTEYNIFEQ
ncbi:hypothetical protein OH491_13500 [Termitidicoccus mucosus]|uniref:phage upper tail fiber protein n=1 Tax=Termitidicoccus mucosus TaxID=1184151 RepID=UPI00318465C8